MFESSSGEGTIDPTPMRGTCASTPEDVCGVGLTPCFDMCARPDQILFTFTGPSPDPSARQSFELLAVIGFYIQTTTHTGSGLLARDSLVGFSRVFPG